MEGKSPDKEAKPESPESPVERLHKEIDSKAIRPELDRQRSDSPSRVLQKQTSVDSPAARLQRQISTDSAKHRVRTMSDGSDFRRSDSVSSRKRRPSLSLGHSDSIPFHIEKPTEDDDFDPSLVPWWTSKRLLLSFTCFIGFFCLYSVRVNLSTAIVCMTREAMKQEQFTNVTINGTTSNVTYVFNASTTTAAPSGGDDGPVCDVLPESSKLSGDFFWDKKLQGLILGAFFWGYTVMQIPSGYLSDSFGPRLMVSLGMFPVAIITILSPFLAKGSPYLLLVGRVLIGVGEAMMYPGMQSLWAKWSPPHERSRLVGFAFGGSQLGNALTFPLSGLLCAYGFDGGWPSVFYITGLACLLWCCLFVFFARDSPSQMASCSKIEVRYIEQSLGVYGQSEEQKLKKKKMDKPWRKIFTSGPVWAILLANGCGNYGAYMLLTQMPTYMKEVLHFDIKSNGAMSMIPYLVFWVFIIIGGQIADVLISRNILSIEWTRKLCCALGTVIPGIFLVLTGYMDCNHQVEAVVLLTLSMGFCGFQFSSFFINHGDIAPRYAGTVFGLTNTGASIPGIIAPYIVGALTPNKTQKEWLVVFYIAGGVYVLGAIIYAVLAKGEVQDWADEDVGTEVLGDEDYPLRGIREDEESDDENKEKKKMVEGDANGVNS